MILMTLLEPAASLVACGAKRFITMRQLQTISSKQTLFFPQPVYIAAARPIHAAAWMRHAFDNPDDCRAQRARKALEPYGIQCFADFRHHFGCVIGEANLLYRESSAKVRPLLEATGKQMQLDWESADDNPWIFFLSGAVLFARPTRVKTGRQRFWYVSKASLPPIDETPFARSKDNGRKD